MITQAKYFIALSMLLLASATPAAQLLFNLYVPNAGSFSPASNWTGNTPMPSMMNISFVMNTLTASSTTFLYAPDIHNTSQSCLGHFDAAGLAISNLSVQTDQGGLWSAFNLSNGGMGGDNAGGNCPGVLFAGMSFEGDGHSFLWSFDPSPGISQADLESSTDPLATLLLGFQGFTTQGLWVTGDWGTLEVAPTVTVTAVPLPSTVALLASGLFSLAWKVRKLTMTTVVA